MNYPSIYKKICSAGQLFSGIICQRGILPALQSFMR